MSASGDFLSQEEVDTLLKDVGADGEEAHGDTDANGVTAYNFASQERIVRGRMPTLEIINERFARLLRIGLFNLVRRTAEISVDPVKLQKYGEFVRNMALPANINLIHVRPLRGMGLVIFEPSLVFLMIDNLFGGGGRLHSRVEGREFSPTELRIIQRLLNLVLEDYAKAWRAVHPIAPEFQRAEMNFQFANIATPNEVVVATTFRVELGDAGGEITICMPYSMIEPIKESLYSSVQGQQLEVDKRWLRLLSKQVQGAQVEIVANLAQTQVNLGQILKLRVGDVIPIHLHDCVEAHIDEVPVMTCRYGISNGQYALKVQQMIQYNESDNTKNGETHG